MSSPSASPDQPVTDLAHRRAEVTRDAIRGAVVDLMAQTHPAAISIPAVAERAGISVRTIYRYFPNKQALLDDVANVNFDRVERLSAGGDGLFADPATWLPFMWERFAEDVPAVRAQHMSGAGLDLRDRRLAGSRKGVGGAIDDRFPDVDPDQAVVLGDAIIAVTSSAMFLELHDRMGWAPDEAAAVALWIVDAMQQRFRTDGIDLHRSGEVDQ